MSPLLLSFWWGKDRVWVFRELNLSFVCFPYFKTIVLIFLPMPLFLAALLQACSLRCMAPSFLVLLIFIIVTYHFLQSSHRQTTYSNRNFLFLIVQLSDHRNRGTILLIRSNNTAKIRPRTMEVRRAFSERMSFDAHDFVFSLSSVRYSFTIRACFSFFFFWVVRTRHFRHYTLHSEASLFLSLSRIFLCSCSLTGLIHSSVTRISLLSFDFCFVIVRVRLSFVCYFCVIFFSSINLFSFVFRLVLDRWWYFDGEGSSD